MSKKSNISKEDIVELDRYADKQAESVAYDQILKLPIPNASRFGSYFIFLLMLFIIIVLYVVKINIIVQSKGLVRTVEDTYHIESTEEGIITNIMARAGDRLQKNDPIISLDSAKKNLNIDQLNNELSGMTNQLNKLLKSYETAQLILKNPTSHLKKQNSHNLQGELLSTYMKLKSIYFNLENIKINNQKSLYERNSQSQEEIRLLNSKISTLLKNKDIAEDDLARERQSLDNKKQMLEDAKKLTSEGYYSSLELNQEKEAYNIAQEAYETKRKLISDIELSILNEKIKLNDLKIKINETQRNFKKQLQDAELSFRQTLETFSDNLSSTSETIQNLTNTITEKKGMLTIIKESIKKTTIYMPFTGYICKMSDKNIGQMLSPGDLITTAYPENSPLEVIADVLNKDIGFISTHTPVTIKVDAYSYKEYGTIESRVKRMIPNITGKGGFSVILKLAKQELSRGEKIYKLFPGLTVEANFITHQLRLYQLIITELQSVYNDNISTLAEPDA
ncbi:MAG: HlyD family efflux transporter periplasmic adaptor subunit [Candidatus Magnetomorum sp.]|nr:HlyD family efflux transporter periplasmic adaptor subunit [Candidatus Magnetomorum sp.]